MYLGKEILIVFFMAFFTCSMEVPISTESPNSTMEPVMSTAMPGNKSYSERGARGITLLPVETQDSYSTLTFNDSKASLQSTPSYEDWWFYPTRRARLSYKDFPGRPGVATWKEISPGAAAENRKSRKVSGPTAASVSSSALSLVKSIKDAHILKVLILLPLLYFG